MLEFEKWDSCPECKSKKIQTRTIIEEITEKDSSGKISRTYFENLNSSLASSNQMFSCMDCGNWEKIVL